MMKADVREVTDKTLLRSSKLHSLYAVEPHLHTFVQLNPRASNKCGEFFFKDLPINFRYHCITAENRTHKSYG
jgi:hypothetical protein